MTPVGSSKQLLSTRGLDQETVRWRSSLKSTLKEWLHTGTKQPPVLGASSTRTVKLLHKRMNTTAYVVTRLPNSTHTSSASSAYTNSVAKSVLPLSSDGACGRRKPARSGATYDDYDHRSIRRPAAQRRPVAQSTKSGGGTRRVQIHRRQPVGSRRFRGKK
jgi:hypothetical protein